MEEEAGDVLERRDAESALRQPHREWVGRVKEGERRRGYLGKGGEGGGGVEKQNLLPSPFTLPLLLLYLTH